MCESAAGVDFAPKILLYDSKVCRLCGEKNENGRPLFRDSQPNEECEVSKLINQYLPVVVQDDGITPRWICPGCHIQLESTAQFFEMILEGQQIIASLLLQQKHAEEAQQGASKSVRVDDLGQLYDTLDQAKWNELFGKPDLISTDKDNVLVPLELCELEDLLKQEEPKPEEHHQQSVPSAKSSDGLQSAEQDWIVTSEVTELNGRLIGFIRNHNESDIGSLVVMEDEARKKRTHAKFVCDICSKVFVQELRYLKHRKAHTILFECSVCLLKFGSNGKLTMHQQETKHNGNGIVEGTSITWNMNREDANGESSDTKGERKNNSYACDNCEDTFPELISVLKHEESVHGRENRTFVCSDCGKSFRFKNMLQRHRSTHMEGRPHQCNVCEAAFKTRSTLTKHARSHAETKRYQCTLCSQQFPYKTSLDLHLKWHDGVKPFECELCSKRFSQRGNLKEHQRVHSGDKPFTCGVCTATFATSSQHRLHTKRHTNERPHECELCSKTFILLENYKTHMRRHRNEKPYGCEVCTRAFAERWALRKHIRTHTREKPYTCKHCAKPFSDSSNLMRHVTTIHGTKRKPVDKQKPVGGVGGQPVEPVAVGALSDDPVPGLESGALAVLTEDEILSLGTAVYMSDH